MITWPICVALAQWGRQVGREVVFQPKSAWGSKIEQSRDLLDQAVKVDRADIEAAFTGIGEHLLR